MKLYAALLAVAVLAAQTAPEVEITAEPHHHLVFENKSVRVFDVEIDSNTSTLMHWHRHDYIAVNLATVDLTNTVKDKAPVPVKVRDGDASFGSASFAHTVRCTGSQPFRNVTIELLQDESLRQAQSHWDTKQDEDRALNTFDGGTQQIFFVKDGIRVSEVELQPNAAVPRASHMGPKLVVALGDLDLKTGAGKSSRTEHLGRGESKWFEGSDSLILSDAGKTSAKFVTLEFP